MKKSIVSWESLQRAFPDECRACCAPIEAVVEEVFEIEVDCQIPFGQMAEICGFPLEPQINPQNFPITGSGVYRAEVAIFSFLKNPPTLAIIAEMKNRGYPPAKIEEIFAIAWHFSHKGMKQNHVVGLGSSWEFAETSLSVKPFSPMISRQTGTGISSIGIMLTDLRWCKVFRFAGCKVLPA